MASKLVGEAGGPDVDVAVPAPYPSDHRGVLVRHTAAGRALLADALTAMADIEYGYEQLIGPAPAPPRPPMPQRQVYVAPPYPAPVPYPIAAPVHVPARGLVAIPILIGVLALIGGIVGWQLYKKLTNNTVVAYFPNTLALYSGDRVQIMGV